MTKFLGRGLRYLDDLFNFQGSEVTTGDVDLSSVQLVADVVQIAAAGRGPGANRGRALYVIVNNHAADLVVTNSINIYTPTTNVPPWPDLSAEQDFQLWCVDAWVSSTGVSITEINAAICRIKYPDDTFIGATFGGSLNILRSIFTSYVGTSVGGAPSTMHPSINTAASTITGGPFVPQYPIYLPRSTDIADPTLFEFVSRTTGLSATNAIGVFEVVAMPNGVKP